MKCKYCGEEIYGGKGDYWHMKWGNMRCEGRRELAYPEEVILRNESYTGESLRSVVLCEETGLRALNKGVCPVHGGDACLYLYKHPYDNTIDRWKRTKQWGE